MNQQAAKFNHSGLKALEKGSYMQAEKQLRKSIKAAPEWAIPWFHLGLVYKKQKRWDKMLRCNQRSTELDPSDKPGFWNLGIAATALGEWEEARRAWRAYGVTVPDGPGPIKMKFGATPIRLNPRDKDEVVWCTRIDPARAIIKNIPLPESKHCYNDLLLHDGEPRGYRENNGNEVPVFDALQLLTPSEYKTYEVQVLFRNIEDIEVLIEMADAEELAVEDWSTIRNLCKHCSEGRPHEHHEIDPPSPDRPVRIGAAAPNQDEAIALFDQWKAQRGGCELMAIECVYEHKKRK